MDGKYLKLDKITLCLITCKRLELFKKTIKSLFDNCLDKMFISNIILIDDNSINEDIQEMNYILNKINIPYIIKEKKESDKGHPQSLNIMYDMIASDYILMLEDDWLFIKPDFYITKSIAIMNNDPSIKQVLLRTTDIMAIDQKLTRGYFENSKYKNINDFDYIKYEYTGCHNRDSQGRSAWCGWNLNPAIWNFKEIRKLGKFPIGEPCFEFNYSRQFWKAGYKVAYFPINYCEHLGTGNSAYVLNGTNK